MPDQERRDIDNRPFQAKPTEAAMPDAIAAQPNNDDWAAAMSEQGVSGQSPDQAGAVEAPAAPVFQKLAPGATGDARNDIDLILNIPVQLTVELGRTKIAIKNLLQLAQGSVVELDGLAGEPMDVLINGYLIAQGEVVVVNDKFGIRLTDIVTPSERMRQLNH